MTNADVAFFTGFVATITPLLLAHVALALLVTIAVRADVPRTFHVQVTHQVTKSLQIAI